MNARRCPQKVCRKTYQSIRPQMLADLDLMSETSCPLVLSSYAICFVAYFIERTEAYAPIVGRSPTPNFQGPWPPTGTGDMRIFKWFLSDVLIRSFM